MEPLVKQLKAKTPCLSLRLRLRASGANPRTTAGPEPDDARTMSGFVRPLSCFRSGLVRLLSGPPLRGFRCGQ